MSIRSEINRITSNISAAYAALAEKNAVMPNKQNSANLASTILSISTGPALPDLTNPASNQEVFLGKEFINESGDKQTGSFTITDELSDQDSLIAQIQTALQGKAAGSPGLPTQEKTVEITENGTVEVVPDEGYVLSKVGVVVDVPVPDGYIQPNGTLEVTENGIHNVAAYESVNVNVEASGGGENPTALLDAALNGSLTSINSNVTSVVAYACRGLTKLTTVNLPNATSIGTYAFYGCTQLTTVSFPNVTTLSEYTFRGCSRLTSIDLPELTTCGDNEFYGTAVPTLYLPKLTNCSTYTFSTMKTTKVILPSMKAIGTNAFRGASIVTVDLATCTNIAANGFQQCSSFAHLILRADSVCTLANTSAFTATLIAKGTGYVYVPAALIETYKTATNWSTYANQFRAIEDYPEICGT